MVQNWQIDGPMVLDIGNENETVGKLKLGLVAGRVDIVTHDDSPTARLEVHEVAEHIGTMTMTGPAGEVTLGLTAAAKLRALPGQADPSLFHRVPERARLAAADATSQGA